MKLSKNFTLKELTASNTAVEYMIDNDPNGFQLNNLKRLAVHTLQPIRNKFGQVNITSGFRSILLNALVGGHINSQHLEGRAADIKIKANRSYLDLYQVAVYIEEHIDFDQLILEYYDEDDLSEGWLHISFVDADKNRYETLTKQKGEPYYQGLIK